MSTLKECEKARRLIRPRLITTPLVFSDHYSALFDREIYLKLENKFYTGSFKERGALNFLLNLSAAQRKRGVCAASAGNHALALSHHARQLGIFCKIVMPLHAPLIKIRSCQESGAEVIKHGETFQEAAAEAKKISAKEGLLLAPAFDHPHVIAGQGTCALEILEQLPGIDSAIVPVGGGGLIAGISTVLRAQRPKTYILGVQSKWAYDAQRGRKSSDTSRLRPRSIADGIAIKTMGKLTAPICRKKVDKLIQVDESQIAENLVKFLELEKTLIEGAAAAAIAGLTAADIPRRCKNTVIVVSGSNIDMNLLSRLIERGLAAHGLILRLRVSVPDRPGTLNSITEILAGQGVNVLQVHHDRSFSSVPGNVEIIFLVEVRNSDHKAELFRMLSKLGLGASEVPTI